MVQDYLRQIRSAKSESARRALLQTLLQRLFGGDAGAESIINKIAVGTEQAINIPHPSGIRVGRADVGYEHVIIEWKQNLRDKKRAHDAKEQLARYLHGKWNDGDLREHTLFATDGVIWRRYAPNYKTVAEQKDNQPPQLEEARGSFELDEDNAHEFYFFLDRWLFGTSKKKLTLENVALDFGESSGAFLRAVVSMKDNAAAREHSETQTAFCEWQRMLSIAYAKHDDTFEMFVFQTYLSTFAKLLAYSFLDKNTDLSDRETMNVLRGDAFDKFNVDNFAEGDFFSWVAKDYCCRDSLSWCRNILIKLSDYDLTSAEEDIFKGLYQEVIDNETRHALGEYYTPDWLCERIVADLDLHKDSRVLDPACGSGSFLRAAIAAIRRRNPRVKAEKLAANIVGIDIHPLAVQITKTTVLLALGAIAESSTPVLLQVYLANALLLSKDANLYGEMFDVKINAQQYQVNMAGFKNDMKKYHDAVQFCDQYTGRPKKQQSEGDFSQRFARGFSLDEKSAKNIINDFYKIYEAMKQARQDGKNSIWRFVLQNLYKPVFMYQKFDVVVGNPPWLKYSDVVNAEYQSLLRGLANELEVMPWNRANMPNLEIAALFLSHASSYFLRPGGKIAFVLPRSLLTGAQHENTRKGAIHGFQLSTLWDLEKVSPLFNVPSTVFFGGQKANGQRVQFPSAGLRGASFAGTLPQSQMSWEAAEKFISEEAATWHLSQMVSSSNNGNGTTAITADKVFQSSQCGYYASYFTKGATIVPRAFYCIAPAQNEVGGRDLNWREIVNCQTDPLILPGAKKPWDMVFEGRLETKYFFRTAIAKNMVPFALAGLQLVVLPVRIKKRMNGNFAEMLNSEDMDNHMSYWCQSCEEAWEARKTEKNREGEIDYLQWLNYRNKLTRQNLNTRFLVLYTASATYACAAVLDRRDKALLDFPFFADSAAYWYATNSLSEANYLLAFLNSPLVSQLITPFQARGLFGPRHISSKILQLSLPQYDGKNAAHKRLATLGGQCAKAAQKIAAVHLDEGGVNDMGPHHLGRVRSDIRNALTARLVQIDKILAGILN